MMATIKSSARVIYLYLFLSFACGAGLSGWYFQFISHIADTSAQHIQDPRFLQFTNEIIEFEGGWVDSESAYAGINKKAHPKLALWRLDLSGIPSHEVKTEVYDVYRGYYDQLRINAISEEIGFVLYDYSVTAGVHQAANSIQAILFTDMRDIDGIVGSKTVSAINTYTGKNLAKKLTSQRLYFYSRLAINNLAFRQDAKGWFNRAVKAYEYSQSMEN